MSIEALMTHDVIIVRPGTTTDRYNDSVPDWTNTTRRRAKAWVSQRTASEINDNRDAEVSTWQGFFPATVDLRSGDRVVWGPITFEVDGPPNPAHRPGSGVHHYEAPLKVVEG